MLLFLFIIGVSCIFLSWIIEKTSPCCEANASNIKCICDQY